MVTGAIAFFLAALKVEPAELGEVRVVGDGRLDAPAEAGSFLFHLIEGKKVEDLGRD
jgi:hypothetical protein